MADVNNNAQQRLADRNTIKQWFKRGLKPLQEHFWTWIDSFWHKSDKLPISSIQNLGATLDNKSNVDHIHIQYTTPEIVQSMIDNQRSSIYRLMSPVATYADLPMDGNENGDVRNVIDTGMNYVWDGEEWDALGGLLDLTNYVTQTQFTTALSDMATQTWVSQQLANVSVDLSGYYTAEEVDWQIGQAITGLATQAWVTQQLADLVTNGTISLDGYATELWVTQQGYLTSSALNGYATQSWVTSQLANVTVDLTGYATEQWVSNQGYLTSSALNDYATQTWVTNQLSNKIDKVTPTKLSYALITPTGTIQTSIPTLGVPIKVLGVDATNTACSTEVVPYKEIDMSLYEPTIVELESHGVDIVDFPNLARKYERIGSQWGYVELIIVE